MRLLRDLGLVELLPPEPTPKAEGDPKMTKKEKNTDGHLDDLFRGDECQLIRDLTAKGRVVL